MKRHFTFVASLTLGILSQLCISHFVGKNNISILLIYLFAPETKWRRDTQKTTTPTWLQEVCENWWWCGSVPHSHFCERSRRNGGRWWPQVRERWCGCIRNLPHAGDCVKSVEQISGRSIALKVIFDLTEDSLDCFSRIVAGWWDPKGLSPYDQGTPLQVRDLDRIVENRRVERCREMLTTLAMLIILLKYSRSTWSHRFFTNGKHTILLSSYCASVCDSKLVPGALRFRLPRRESTATRRPTSLPSTSSQASAADFGGAVQLASSGSQCSVTISILSCPHADILNASGKKMEDLCPTSHNLDVPFARSLSKQLA